MPITGGETKLCSVSSFFLITSCAREAKDFGNWACTSMVSAEGENDNGQGNPDEGTEHAPDCGPANTENRVASGDRASVRPVRRGSITLPMMDWMAFKPTKMKPPHRQSPH